MNINCPQALTEFSQIRCRRVEPQTHRNHSYSYNHKNSIKNAQCTKYISHSCTAGPQEHCTSALSEVTVQYGLVFLWPSSARYCISIHSPLVKSQLIFLLSQIVVLKLWTFSDVYHIVNGFFSEPIRCSPNCRLLALEMVTTRKLIKQILLLHVAKKLLKSSLVLVSKSAKPKPACVFFLITFMMPLPSVLLCLYI